MNWYLVNLKPGKRELFVKYLNQAIQKNQLEDIFLGILTPADSIYKDMVFLQLKDLKTARPHLQLIEHFQKIEPRPIPPEQISKIVGV
ncbi:chromosome segregation ATPase-like protein [Gloeothece citriformis PCC 7424]|uniref:Chromosome segregation ATPase-like protein n=1 Tax=Gloeothece citriformis (strain PCC 7424) TaxID=65393 RepID=B7KH45_GLOC7|nr:hypothetical protein [Gloeothece citriformis]ACK69254.1 chromosome segregation ATPase-like protein [Gloeothece citriformis PCC 7424]